MHISMNDRIRWPWLRKSIGIEGSALFVHFILNRRIDRANCKRILFTTLGKFIEATVLVATQLSEKRSVCLLNYSNERERRTDLPGELHLNGFLSDGADLERSLSSPPPLPALPSWWKGFRSKKSFGCMFNLKTPALSDALWCAASFYSTDRRTATSRCDPSENRYSFSFKWSIESICFIFVGIGGIFFKAQMWESNQNERDGTIGEQSMNCTRNQNLSSVDWLWHWAFLSGALLGRDTSL